MVAMYLPPPFVPFICWVGGTGDSGVPAKVDVAVSIARWRRDNPPALRDPILPLSAYPGELEKDLLEAILADEYSVDPRLNKYQLRP